MNEEKKMGSMNHSIIQAMLSWYFCNDGRFSAMTELSLDVSEYDFSKYGIKVKDEFKPDVSVYTRKMPILLRDVVRTIEIPSLVIEILSPSQRLIELTQKNYAYFDLGVKSCWLVIPELRLISIYSGIDNFTTFDNNETVIDPIMDVRLPLATIFGDKRNGKVDKK